MAFEFADEFNREVYAEWHQPLLERLFGHMIDLHYDLYELTHSHRRDHNGDVDHGLCTAWPSPPYRAPVWRLIVEKIGAKRFLEVGTAIGYTAVLMADAGGPESRLDTIEIDPSHVDLGPGVLDLIAQAHQAVVDRDDPDEHAHQEGQQDDHWNYHRTLLFYVVSISLR